MTRRIFEWFTASLLVLVTAGCGSDGPAGPGTPASNNAVASVTVSLAATSVEAGLTVAATAVARNSQGDPVTASFTWNSSETGVATVSTGGVVRGTVPGNATITATASGVTGSGSIQVVSRNINSIVEAIRSARGLPAMAGALVTRDGIIAMGVAGTRRVSGPAVTLADKWHIGSNLKAMTAALAARAIDQGLIDWTTTVEEPFPELDAGIRAEYRDATLADLLAHGAGIRNDPPASAYTGATARAQRESLVAWALGAPPIGAFGEHYYSNPSYVIAGAMVERALNGTYEDLVASHLAGPIGATGIGWGPTTGVGGTDQPVGHRLQGGAWVACEACDNPPGLSAAGRAHVPLAAFATIIQELLRADAGVSTLISAANGRTLFTGYIDVPGSPDRYAMGWNTTTRPWAPDRAAYHSGSNVSNHSVVWLGLGNGIGLIALTNAADLTGGASGQALDALVVRLLTLHQTGN
jgi:CubicO group peptidase (beta-lactamase class C family)